MTPHTLRELIAIIGFVTLTVGASCAYYPAGFVLGGLILLTVVFVGHLRSGKPATERKAVVVGEAPDGTIHFQPWPSDPGPETKQRIVSDSMAAQ